MKENKNKKSIFSQEEKEEFLSELLAKIARLGLEGSTKEGGIHGGKPLISLKEDFSDVYVITPFEIIPWNELSKTNDKEMNLLVNEIKKHFKSYLEITKEKPTIELNEENVLEFMNYKKKFLSDLKKKNII